MAKMCSTFITFKMILSNMNFLMLSKIWFSTKHSYIWRSSLPFEFSDVWLGLNCEWKLSHNLWTQKVSLQCEFSDGKDIFLLAKGFARTIIFKKHLSCIGVLIFKTHCFWLKTFPHSLQFITLKRFLLSIKMLHIPYRKKDFLYYNCSTDWIVTLEWKLYHVHKISLKYEFSEEWGFTFVLRYFYISNVYNVYDFSDAE